jgi:hypothetical protein
MNTYQKYPRTPHLPWSEGSTSDDKVLSSASHFNNKTVVVTEKMDGENTSLYSDHIHARSLDSLGGEDRAWVKQFWAGIRREIPTGWRVCGENLWARHSIEYDNLKSYFYGFSIWDERNIALSWEETERYFELLNVQPVTVLYEGKFNETLLKRIAQNMNKNVMEGYVVRLTDSFHYEDFGSSVSKFVRKNHVQTDKHWRHQQLIPNGLHDN